MRTSWSQLRHRQRNGARSRPRSAHARSAVTAPVWFRFALQPAHRPPAGPWRRSPPPRPWPPAPIHPRSARRTAWVSVFAADRPNPRSGPPMQSAKGPGLHWWLCARSWDRCRESASSCRFLARDGQESLLAMLYERGDQTVHELLEASRCGHSPLCASTRRGADLLRLRPTQNAPKRRWGRAALRSSRCVGGGVGSGSRRSYGDRRPTDCMTEPASNPAVATSPR